MTSREALLAKAQPFTRYDLTIGEQIVRELHGLNGYDAWAEHLAKVVASVREGTRVAQGYNATRRELEILELRKLASHWKERHDEVLQKHIECCGVAQAAPEGWRLVPIEPTQEMIAAAEDARETYAGYCYRDAFTEMVKAAPVYLVTSTVQRETSFCSRCSGSDPTCYICSPSASSKLHSTVDRNLLDAELCGDCPPAGYPTDKTRCVVCPRSLQECGHAG